MILSERQLSKDEPAKQLTATTVTGAKRMGIPLCRAIKLKLEIKLHFLEPAKPGVSRAKLEEKALHIANQRLHLTRVTRLYPISR